LRMDLAQIVSSVNRHLVVHQVKDISEHLLDWSLIPNRHDGTK
jgi:hypothetical protein